MSPILENLSNFILSTISRRKAKQIARSVCSPSLGTMIVHGEKPDGWQLYGIPDNEPCWFIQVLWDHGVGGSLIQSSWVVVISRLSGNVIYSGTAQDEG
jgi:hypothetical protein